MKTTAYDRMADDYRSRVSKWTWRKRFAVVDAPQLAVARGSHAVLELGCGTGRLLAQVDAPIRVGIDISLPMLRHGVGLGLSLVQADAHGLPFGAQSFDTIIAGNVAFRYFETQRVFDECARVLRPGGVLALHQYAQRTWRLADVLGRTAPSQHPSHLRTPYDYDAPARLADLRCEARYCWRSLRVPPYAIAVPPWLPGCLWDHCVLVFRRTSRATTS